MQAKGYVIDYDDWHAHVHGVLPYDRCLMRDERLRAIIKACTGGAPSVWGWPGFGARLCQVRIEV